MEKRKIVWTNEIAAPDGRRDLYGSREAVAKTVLPGAPGVESIPVNGHDGVISRTQVLVDAIDHSACQLCVAVFDFKRDRHIKDEIGMRGAVNHAKMYPGCALLQSLAPADGRPSGLRGG